MERVIDKFTSSTYRILKQIHDCQITLPDGDQYIPISQAELSRIVGTSTITMNKYFKQFQDDGIIAPYGNTKGKYKLTDKGLVIVSKIDELEKELMEVE